MSWEVLPRCDELARSFNTCGFCRIVLQVNDLCAVRRLRGCFCLNSVIDRFIARAPMAVAIRGTLEYAFVPEPLDAIFEQIVGDREDRHLLFSTCVDVMGTVVTRVNRSIHAAYRAAEAVPVSIAAVYQRFQRMPIEAGRALVRHTAQRLEPVIRAMKGAAPDPLPGYRVQVLDGNHLAHTQRRLKILRDVAAGPLPGQSLVVLDPALGLALDVIPCVDGHAQERSLLDAVIAVIRRKDVWIADRNFCTTKFLFGIAERGGYFVIRRHGATLSWEKESPWESKGRTGTGALSRNAKVFTRSQRARSCRIELQLCGVPLWG